MGLLIEGEVLRVRRRRALGPLLVGLVFFGIGIAVMRGTSTSGDTGLLVILLGAAWFLPSGAAVIRGLLTLLRPPIFAVLNDEGVSFPSQDLPLIRWRDLAAVRLGLRTVTRRKNIRVAWRTPLILTVRHAPLIDGNVKGVPFTRPDHALADGTAELLVRTDDSPLPNDALIRKLGQHPGVAIDLRPAAPRTATLGGVQLNSHPPSKGWGAYVGAVVFLAFGLTFAVLGATRLAEARASSDWPVTIAEILSAQVETGTRSGPRGSSTPTRTPRISYRYHVAGQTYTSDRAAFAYRAADSSEFIKRFPVGATVPAYYDPQNPADAVLVREGYGSLWIFVAFGTVFAAIGSWLLQRLLAGRHRSAGPLSPPQRATRS